MSEIKGQGVQKAPNASNTTETLKPLDVIDAAALTKGEFDAEMARLTLESAQLELKMKKANLQDMEERLAEREGKRETVGNRAKINGQTLKQLAHARKMSQDRCNHRKGGNGAVGVVAGQGDDNQYAVLKHKMANADTWIRCLRCGKWWKPPIQADYETIEGYQGAVAEYFAAKEFPTRNVTSGSVAFQWGDGGKYYREVTRHTTSV